MRTKIQEQKFQKYRNKKFKNQGTIFLKKIWEQKFQKSGNKNFKNLETIF
jgi:hypothetical protein